MLPAPTSRPGGLRFRLFGFPVRIDPLFVVVMAILGAAGQDGLALDHILVWIGVAAVGVLAHELGHAFVARTTGAKPTIDLYGMGGVTTFVPPRPMGRFRSFAVSVTGPLIGVGIGLALLYGVPDDAFTAGSIGEYTVQVAVWVNLGWGLLNMLPILPLDGGQMLLAVLPGSPSTRQRTAAGISVVTAVGAAVVAYVYGYLFGAIFAAWFVANNLAFLLARQADRPASTTRRPTAERARPGQPQPDAIAPAQPPSPAQLQQTLLWLLDQGEPTKAGHLLAGQPPAALAQVDPAVRGLVAALTGFAGRGAEQVREAMAERPHDPVPAGAYLRLLVYRGEWHALLDFLDRHGAAVVRPDAVRWAHDVAVRQENADVAQRLQRMLDPAR